MNGLHLLADLQGVNPALPLMTQPNALRALCTYAVAASGLQAVGELFHQFDPLPGAPASSPVGVTGVILLAESHLAVHTWPERGVVTIDAYVCNMGDDNSSKARQLVSGLIEAFAPAHADVQAVHRGRGSASGS
jgi:S-adenosylmethionine decarboxylase proenzyme